MSKVYMVSVVVGKDRHEKEDIPKDVYFGYDIYYVLADNSEDAIEHLREQIRKYYFKAKLSKKSSEDPKRLGDRIIVEEFVTEEFVDAPLQAEDVTAMAYLYNEEKRDLWVDWDITLEDVYA